MAIQIPDQPAPTKQPDPLAKPTWAQWKEWDVFRRLLNDHRLRGFDAAFKLWHWLHNCKKEGETKGFRAEAWYIARKHKWKPATVYAMSELLKQCGYLTWTLAKGCVKVFKVLDGINTLPEAGQVEFPFILPTRTAPKGTPKPASSASMGTPGLPVENSRTAPKGTPYYSTCDLCVSSNVTPAERVSMERERERIVVELKRIEDGASHDAWGPHYSEEEKARRKQLKERDQQLRQALGCVV